MRHNNLQAETLVTNKIDLSVAKGQIPAGSIGIIDRRDFGDVAWVIFEQGKNECTAPVWCHVSEIKAI